MPTVRVLLCTIALACLAPNTAVAAPAVHAHRGGPVINGAVAFAENTMPAFRNAWERYGAVIEMDVKLTADRVPVVFHDATLDRVTPCSGRIDAQSWPALAACPVDAAGGAEAIPSLSEFLAWARDAGPVVNLEIKNNPQEPDFDLSEGFASTVVDTLAASGFPLERLIVQSFWPANLDVARRRLPGVQTSLLTLSALNSGAPAYAAMNGYTWVSPEWPVDGAFVEDAHGRGLGVVPFTLNDPAAVKAAAEIGVDALITDDVPMARAALGLADPSPRDIGADRSPPQIVAQVPDLVSDAATSPRLRLRWDAADPSGVVGFDADVRARAFDWRQLRDNSPARFAVFTARPGERYVLRLRARDGAGNLGPYTFAGFSVPLDLRPRGWRVVRSRGAWRRTLAVPRARRVARLSFRGTRLRIIVQRAPDAGRLTITLDGRRQTVSTAGPVDERALVFDSGPIAAGRHRVRLRARGRVALDGYATR